MAEVQTRGRGRPKGTGKVQPNEIVGVAVGALTRGGFRQLSMRGVARELGVSLSSVQNYFATKDELWRGCVDFLAQEFQSDTGDSEVEPLGQSLDAMLKRHTTRQGLVFQLLTDNEDGFEERLDYLAEKFASILRVPFQRLKELQDIGLVRAIDGDAFFSLVTIGIGAISGAAPALERVFGFDITTDDGRKKLAADLADIITLGVLER